MLRTSVDLVKENGFKLKKKCRRYPGENLIDADYADDLVLLTAQSKSLHSLEPYREESI